MVLVSACGPLSPPDAGGGGGEAGAGGGGGGAQGGGSGGCDACVAPPNAVPTCTDGRCDFTCEAGFHRCGDVCARDDDASRCGAQCVSCPALGGTATCAAGACGVACGAGAVFCGGACVVESATACGATCAVCDDGLACLGGACRDACADDEVFTEVGCARVGQRIASGNFHACALHDGGVACWGAGSAGALGSGPYDGGQLPRYVLGVTSAVEVTTGDSASCARTAGGGVRCWGSNVLGQLGDGTTTDAFAPVVPALETPAAEVQAGANHVCARLGDGGVWCWGFNAAGQVGVGSMAQTTHERPAQALVPGPVTRVFAGGNQSFAVGDDGVLWAWGEDAFTGPSAGPRPLARVDGGLRALAASPDHTCVVRDDGRVTCWGRGLEGQLGYPVATTADQGAADVPGVEAARGVCLGQRFTCVALADAGAVCFGDNTSGQLGRGNNVGGPTPQPVIDLPPIVGLSCQHRSVCAATAAGGVVCWGDNSLGQLGAPTPPASTHPSTSRCRRARAPGRQRRWAMLPRVHASLLLTLAAVTGAEPPPELPLALSSLRAGEVARLETAAGPAEALTLVRADLTVSPDDGRVEGQVSLRLTAARPMTEVLLRLSPNANHPGAVRVRGVTVNGARASVSTGDLSLLRVRLPEPTRGLIDVVLRLEASAPRLAAGGPGDEPGDYGAFARSADVVALPRLLPMPATRADGTVLEASTGIGDLGTAEPAHFVVSLRVPAGWRVAAPGRLLGETPEADGRRRFTWAVAAARECPLFAVRGYEVETKRVGDVAVESWHTKANAKAAGEALEHAARALELLQAKLGPYPYASLRVLEVPLSGGAGGMEFPGLVTVSSMLYGGGADALAGLGVGSMGGVSDAMLQHMLEPLLGPLLRDALEFAIDHEVAHQYTAMLVGSDPIAEPLADEALTQHLALLVWEWRHGVRDADRVREAHLKMPWQLYRLLGGEDGPARRPTSDFSSNQEYAALVYGKAPLLFDAQREAVGDEAWLSALKRYVADYRYRWAKAGDFTRLLAKQTGNRQVLALERRWWDEAHGDEDIGAFALGVPGHRGATQPMLDADALRALDDMMRDFFGE